MHALAGSTKRFAGALLALILIMSALVLVEASSARADTAPAAGLPATVSADALPTVQIDGVAWSQAVVGNYVYVGGSFANARPAGAAAGTDLIPRANLLRYNITTGVLDSSFAPSLNGQVLAVTASPDGSRIYVGGDFTTANGANHYRLAAYSTATGAIISSFAPVIDAKVKAITATNSTVYFGGSFSTVNGNSRERLAAVSASTGAVLSWAPSADATITAMLVNPSGDKVIVTGQFQNIGTTPEYGMAGLDPISGVPLPWAANATVKDAGVNAALDTLSTDGTNIYGGGYVFGAGGNLEGVFNANGETGAINWIEDCHGDTYGTYETSGVVYVVSHEHFCGDVGGWPQASGPQYNWVFQRTSSFTTATTGVLLHNPVGGYADFGGDPAPTLLNWWPSYTTGTYTGQDQAAWTVTGNGQYVVEGGEFPSINGTAQQGLVRFAVSTIAPNKQGPVVTGSSFVPSLVSLTSGTVRVAFQADWDRDNTTLTYKVVRDSNTASPVYTTTVNSTFWNRPELGFTDTGLVPGSTHKYRLYVNDPFGNTVAGDTVTVTVGSNVASAYVNQVIADGASTYYRLDEASGTTAYDWAGYNDGIVTATGITRGAAGAISGDSDTATTFDGSTGNVATPTAIAGPTQFSIEGWINTTTTRGGKIIGFGSAQTGSSSSYDRQIYMDNAGHIIFGVYNGTTTTIASTKTYNDGKYHQVVATLSPTAGLALYVDGARVATNALVTTAQAYTGYWRIGGDNLTSWPSAPTSSYFAGTIDEAAIFSGVLSASEVANEFAIGGGAVLPTASFTYASSGLVATFNGSGSSEAGGTISNYAWNFGDGGTTAGTSATATHTFAAAGTYQVTLTVTDGSGHTNSTTSNVMVPTNQPPVAAFTSSSTGLAASFDGSTSHDPDGTISSYAWNFGDGTTKAASTTATATHTYAAAGSFPVTLTVVDNSGNSTSITNNVTVAATNVAPTAAFTSTITGQSVAFDGSTSHDSDGTIVSYAWTFGDGSTQAATATPTASHIYASAGSYPVTLTVVDNGGLSGNQTQTISVGTVTAYATDAFGRTVTGGWGTADLGGTWGVTGSASTLSVSGGAGHMTLSTAGASTEAYLAGVSSSSTETDVSLSLNEAQVGGGTYVSVVGRRITSPNDYRVKLHFIAGGTVGASLESVVNNAETVVKSVAAIPGLTYNAGDVLDVRLQVSGTSPTTLSVVIWKDGTTQPTSWTLTGTDSTSVLQATGGVGLLTYVSSSFTAVPEISSFDNLNAGPLRAL